MSKALHRSARGVTTDLGSIPGSITTGHDRESHRAAHNWPSVVWTRGRFGRGAFLGSSHSSTPFWQARHLQADFCHQVNCFL